MEVRSKKVFPQTRGIKTENYSLEDAVYENNDIVKDLKVICWKVLTEADCEIKKEKLIKAKDEDTNNIINFKTNSHSLLSIAEGLLKNTDYTLSHKYFPEQGSIMLAVKELDQIIENSSLIVFSDGLEPEDGATSLENVFPSPGTLVMVCCSGKDYYEGY